MCIGFSTETAPVLSDKPVLVWDIDGTLLEPKPVGRQALNMTFQQRYHIAGAFDSLDFSGATDHALWDQVSQQYPHLGLTTCEADGFFGHYVGVLETLLAQNPLYPLPSVSTLIPLLSARGWPLALGTGNVRAGAFTKLGAAGLAPYFPCGGYSRPHLDRSELLRQVTRFFPNRLLVVIGDTPRDIEAAQLIGALSIGTATGRHASSVLQAHGADIVFDRLPDPVVFLKTLTDLIRRKAQERNS